MATTTTHGNYGRRMYWMFLLGLIGTTGLNYQAHHEIVVPLSCSIVLASFGLLKHRTRQIFVAQPVMPQQNSWSQPTHHTHKRGQHFDPNRPAPVLWGIEAELLNRDHAQRQRACKLAQRLRSIGFAVAGLVTLYVVYGQLINR